MVCLAGDFMLHKAAAGTLPGNGRTKNHEMVRAFVDSSTHAIIGFLVWALVENPSILGDFRKWLNCFAAAALAASVDLDHFWAAGELNLKKAMHLTKRPPFHNTSLVCALTLVFAFLQKWKPKMWMFSMMFLCSWLSHHLRDANHRGLWVFPFGHTPLFSKKLYIMCILILAAFVRIAVVVHQGSTGLRSTEGFAKVIL
ncbi:chromosome 5 open reading frame 28 [Plakobranchus ocellatus]|uniref:Transmembrane protein 267 n=1 Tax=Plakobranchus ocellatus TaxID=259542 RepID=A0AAV3YHP3_9GAST|nr:chromosome 5 open reading frame 28 [Plakobranchus ocellatus]